MQVGRCVGCVNLVLTGGSGLDSRGAIAHLGLLESLGAEGSLFLSRV